MKQKKSSSFKDLPKGVKITIIVVGILILGAIASLFTNNGKKDSGETSGEGQNNTSQEMSITEAQTKCMLMEEADMVNYMGEPFGEATTKKAEEHCLAGWDMWQNPENTEEKFIEIIKSDWEIRKGEVLEGYTLEQYYEEISK